MSTITYHTYFIEVLIMLYANEQYQQITEDDLFELWEMTDADYEDLQVSEEIVNDTGEVS